MFDNPNEELKKLEQQLLEVEKKDEDFESFYSEILREFGPVQETSAPKKTATKKKSAPAATGKTGDKAKKSGKKSPKKKQSLKGLVITLCLECAGILAIVVWWILRIL